MGAPTRFHFQKEPLDARRSGTGDLGSPDANPELLFFVPSSGDHYGIGPATDSTDLQLPQGAIGEHLSISNAVNSPERHLLVQRPGSHVEIVR